MSIWSDAARDLHEVAGEPATYVSSATGRSFTVQAVLSRPTRVTSGRFGEDYVQSYTAIEVLVEEVPEPQERDLFLLENRWWEVQGTPTLDSSRSIWTAGVVEARRA